ncbi:MAG: adenylate/guanylate cyclase domain-containing protein [Labilithrix sp.]|nr:adenylate/guanylate cyclase domain-containing protein [Labilithrix sp.]MCW5814784.1 adenylate/guanylate cyclase domain-containing protein [Labilithrix sp.]
MRSVVVSSSFSLSSSPGDVWPFITDTDRTNRLVIGSANVYRPIEKGTKSSARFLVEAKAAGMTMTYEEAPFEWTLNKSFSVYRKMRSGPLESYTYGITLDPAPDGGTKVTVRLDLVPRHWLLRPIAQIEGNRIVARMAKLAESIDAHLRDKAPSPYLKPSSPANEERLDFAQRELEKRDLDAKAIATLVDLIRNGPDADLVRIRPFELAHEHGVDEREMLRICLHAVTLGVVELRWALVCPSCRTASDQVTSLAEIGDASHCQLCDLQFGVELDKAVEATFVPHPSVREVSNMMFCIGGPARTPHVVAQAVVDARGEKSLEAPAEAGRYRVFARGGAIASVDVTSEGATSATVTLEGEALTPPAVDVAPGASIVVHNRTSTPLHVKLERLGYASRAATAHVVTTLSEFRRFFSKDLLKPSTPLKVASVAILFSDLTGSTALYTRAGDAAAFRLVDDHFDVLRKVIDEHGGSVVKTMGDAIMAAFIEPLACVRASIACLHAFETFRVDADNGELTGIKLGLFAGPCYVVTANDAIDYFGQTVNCASRVQHCAETGEIVFEEEVWDRLPEVDKSKLRLVSKLETTVKGVAHPLRLVRTKLMTEIVSQRHLTSQKRASSPELV